MWHQTDRWVLIAMVLTAGIWILNLWASSVGLLYANFLLVSALFGYALWRGDPQRQLRRAWLIGMIGAVVFAYIDSLFANFRFALITYLKTNDWHPFGEVPLSLIVMWGCFITFALYFYQKARAFWASAYPAMFLTAIGVMIANVAIEWLGDGARLWNWNAERIQSGYLLSVPLFIPIAYGVAFLFSPYILKNPLIGGLRCGIVLGVMRFAGFALIRYLT